MSSTFTSEDVRKVSTLATIPLNDGEIKSLADGFTKTMSVVETLTNIDTTGTNFRSHVTGLVNVTREDEVDQERMFTQEEALINAKRTHNGFFVVDQVIDQE